MSHLWAQPTSASAWLARGYLVCHFFRNGVDWIMDDHVEILVRLGACELALRFASKYASAQEAWDACEVPSWMVWLIQELKPETKENLVQAIKAEPVFRRRDILQKASTAAFLHYLYCGTAYDAMLIRKHMPKAPTLKDLENGNSYRLSRINRVRSDASL
jgi:hypothetical protein